MVVSTSELMKIIDGIGHKEKISFTVSTTTHKPRAYLTSLVGIFFGGILFRGGISATPEIVAVGAVLGGLIGLKAGLGEIVALRSLSDIVLMDFTLLQQENISIRLAQRVEEIKNLNALDLIVRLLKDEELMRIFMEELTKFIKEEKKAEKVPSPVQNRAEETTDNTCGICYEEPKKIMFLCGHSACAGCASQLTRCHMCQQYIGKRITIYNN